MPKTFISIIALTLLTFAGCGNLSPRMDEDIQNQGGKIDKIEKLQNSVLSRIGTLESHAEITDSKLDRIQQGFANFQQNYDNSGVQILSGPGGLVIAILAIIAGVVIAFYYRSSAIAKEKAADILAEKIVEKDDPALEEEIFKAVMHTSAEETVLKLISKHQRAAIQAMYATNKS